MKDICIREKYEGKNGEEKTNWNKIGFIFESNGKEYMKLYHIPNTLISIFEQKPKETQDTQNEPF